MLSWVHGGLDSSFVTLLLIIVILLLHKFCIFGMTFVECGKMFNVWSDWKLKSTPTSKFGISSDLFYPRTAPMESSHRTLSVRCTRCSSRLEMQRSFVRTSLGHSTLTKVVQSISRCIKTFHKTLGDNSSSWNMNLYHCWCWRTKYTIIFRAIKTTFANSPEKISLFIRLWLARAV